MLLFSLIQKYPANSGLSCKPQPYIFLKNVSQIGNSLFFKLIKPNLISGKKKSSLKETYDRTTIGSRSKAQAPQGTSQQIPQRTPDLSKTEESDENIYSEVINLYQSMEWIQEGENLPLDLTKTGMVCFHFYQNLTLGQFRGHNTAVYKISSF